MSSVATEIGPLRSKLEEIGQEHLLTFWEELSEDQRRSLTAQLDSLDLDKVPGYVERYVRNKPSFAAGGRIEPATYYPLDASRREWDRNAYFQKGEDVIRAGKVAAFTVAGGQGSRLGYDGPKGKFPGGAVTGKPLFACLAEWITGAERRWKVTIPWYIMTSPLNHEATVEFFEKHGHFGLRREDIMFFQQGVMPSLDIETGRILLADKHVVATNPDGHGGSLLALHKSGAIEDMKRRGIEHISYCQIDNPIARVIDPVFLGLHVHAPDSSGQMSSKMVEKTDPAEKVGVFAKVNGRTRVVEYSDLPDELARQRDDDGSLAFKCGSIAIHTIGVEFVESLNAGEGFSLPFHRAEKKVACIDPDSGERIDPDSPNAVKLEAFVFDALAECEKSVVMETDRIDEFAPIKNAEGKDSPESSKRIQTERAARWIEKQGGEVPRTSDGEPDCTLEISPITAMWAEELDKGALPKIDRGAPVAL